MKISEYSMPPQADHYGAPHPGAKQSLDADASVSSERAAAISDASKKKGDEAVAAGKAGLHSDRARPEHDRVQGKSVVTPPPKVSAKAASPNADHVSISSAGLKLAADDRGSIGTPLPPPEQEPRGVSKNSGAASHVDAVPVSADKTAVISTATNKAADATAATQGKLLRVAQGESEDIHVSLSLAAASETGGETRTASLQAVPASVASAPGSKKEGDAAVVLNAAPHPLGAVPVSVDKTAVISTASNRAADATAATQGKLLRAAQGESEDIRVSLSLAAASETGGETRTASSQAVPASVASASDSKKEGDAAVVPNAAPHQAGYSESGGMSLELSLNTAFLSSAFSAAAFLDDGRAGPASVYPEPAAAGKAVASQQSGDSESEELNVALNLGFKFPPQAAAVCSQKEVSDASGAAGDPKLQLLVSLLEKMTGQKIKLFDHEELMSAQSSAIGNISSQYADAGTNFSMRSSYSETEQISLREEGVIKTGDGQEIKFSLNLTAQFQYSRSSIIQEGEGANKTAPPAINFGGTAAQLSSQRFSFGAYSDENSEQTGMTVLGSGFLVLGRNGDDDADAGSDSDDVGAVGKDIGKAKRHHNHHGRIKEKASPPVADRQKLKGGKEAPVRDLHSFGISEVSLTVINSQFDLKTVTAQLLGTVHSTGAPSTKTVPAVSN